MRNFSPLGQYAPASTAHPASIAGVPSSAFILGSIQTSKRYTERTSLQVPCAIVPMTQAPSVHQARSFRIAAGKNGEMWSMGYLAAASPQYLQSDTPRHTRKIETSDPRLKLESEVGSFGHKDSVDRR